MVASVPLGYEKRQTIQTAEGSVGRPGHRPVVSAVNMLMAKLALKSDATTSKYHHSNEVLFRRETFGASNPLVQDSSWLILGPVEV